MATEQKQKEEKPQKPQKKLTKTAAIQRYLKRKPEAKPREVVAALAKKGMQVTPATVSTIKNQMKNKGMLPAAGGAAKAKRATASARRGRPRKAAAANATLDMLKQAKSLAETAGGVDKAKKLLDALAELQA